MSLSSILILTGFFKRLAPAAVLLLHVLLPLSNHLVTLAEQLHLFLAWNEVQDPIELVVQELILAHHSRETCRSSPCSC